MDTHMDFPIPESIPIETLQSETSEEIEGEEAKFSRADRRRIKQRQRRQNWRKNNQAKNKGAQPETILSLAKPLQEIKNKIEDLITHYVEDHSEPVQRTKLPCPSPRQREEKFLAEFRAMDAGLGGWQLMHMIPDTELEGPLRSEMRTRVSFCVRHVLARKGFSELVASADKATLDEHVAGRAKELASFQKWLLTADRLQSKPMEEIGHRGLRSSLETLQGRLDTFLDTINREAVLVLVVPQLEEQLHILKTRLESLDNGKVAAR